MVAQVQIAEEGVIAGGEHIIVLLGDTTPSSPLSTSCLARDLFVKFLSVGGLEGCHMGRGTRGGEENKSDARRYCPRKMLRLEEIFGGHFGLQSFSRFGGRADIMVGFQLASRSSATALSHLTGLCACDSSESRHHHHHWGVKRMASCFPTVCSNL